MGSGFQVRRSPLPGGFRVSGFGIWVSGFARLAGLGEVIDDVVERGREALERFGIHEGSHGRNPVMPWTILGRKLFKVVSRRS